MSKEKNISKNDLKRKNAKASVNNTHTTSYGAYIGLFISLALIVAYIGYSVCVQFGVISSKTDTGLVTAEELANKLDQYVAYYGGDPVPVGLYNDTYAKKQEEAAKAQEEAEKATEDVSEAASEDASEEISENAEDASEALEENESVQEEVSEEVSEEASEE